MKRSCKYENSCSAVYVPGQILSVSGLLMTNQRLIRLNMQNTLVVGTDYKTESCFAHIIFHRNWGIIQYIICQIITFLPKKAAI